MKLPERMELVWLRAMKASEAEVARELGMTRQAVNKAVKEARAKLSAWFLKMAEIMNCDLIRMDLARGFSVMRSRQLGIRVYFLYVPGKGLRAVYGTEPLCPGRDGRRHCEEIAKAAREMGLVKERDPEEAIRELIKVMESS